MKKSGLQYLFVMIAMCGLVGASVGICSGSAGLFYSFISKELQLSSGSVSLMYTIQAMIGAVAGLFVPRILKKEKMLKPLIFVGAALMAGGTFLLSLAGNIVTLYAFSILRGIGSGLMSFVLATTVINNWFYARNGLMVSIAMAFSGIPNVLLSNIFTGYIQAHGWRSGYVFVTFVILAFCVPAILLPVTMRPQQKNLTPYGYEDYVKYREANRDKVVVEAGRDHIPLISPQMAALMLFTVNVCIIAGFLQQMPSFAVSIGMTAAIGASMASAASLANILSKLMYGVLTDKIGPHKSSLLCAFINLVSIFMLLFIHTPFSVVLSAFLYGFSFANSATAMSVLTRETFGIENYTRVYPLISFAGSSANAIGVTLLGTVYDGTKSFTAVFLLLMILQILTILYTFGLLKTKQAKAA
ncbi:MAG: MFS transporter [Solobacterium sp.]|nr:MFS transporter [Solobacterium sp.]